MTARRYEYVGPEHVRAAAAAAAPAPGIASVADLSRWLGANSSERDGATIIATFVVTLDGALRVASRRSEHIACAGGQPVLAAGEIAFTTHATPQVDAVSNLSTGYCPEPSSWPSVAHALDAAGIRHPGAFTTEHVFRRCPACGERNLVKDGWFVCAVCDADLPAAWNFASDP